MIRMPSKRDELIITEHPFILRRKIRNNAATKAMRVIEQQFPELFIDRTKTDTKSGDLINPEVKSHAPTIS